MEFNLLVRPTMGFPDELKCQTVRGRDQEGDKDQERRRSNNVSAAGAPNLKLKIPSHDVEGERDEESNDGFKTPTSPDHKIPAILQCPPAPRKPKSIPSRKRKAYGPRIPLDLSKEIESLFPTPLLLHLGGKIRRIKEAGNDPINIAQ